MTTALDVKKPLRFWRKVFFFFVWLGIISLCIHGIIFLFRAVIFTGGVAGDLYHSAKTAHDIPLGTQCFLRPTYAAVIVVGIEGEGREALYTISPDESMDSKPRLARNLQVQRKDLCRRGANDEVSVEGVTYDIAGLRADASGQPRALLRKRDGTLVMVPVTELPQDRQIPLILVGDD